MDSRYFYVDFACPVSAKDRESHAAPSATMITLPLIATLLPSVVIAFQGRFNGQSPILDSESSSPLNAKFDSFVQETLADWHIPGLAIAVIDGNSTYSKARASECCERMLTDLGVWHCYLSRHRRHARYSLLRSKHYQSLHLSGPILLSRRQ